MNIFYEWRHKKRGKAIVRLARMTAFNDIIERLAGHRGGKTFMVNTDGLKLEPPHLVISERFSLIKLNYAHCVASLAMYHRRKFEIVYQENALFYIIY